MMTMNLIALDQIVHTAMHGHWYHPRKKVFVLPQWPILSQFNTFDLEVISVGVFVDQVNNMSPPTMLGQVSLFSVAIILI